jgi:hypothetical protein
VGQVSGQLPAAARVVAGALVGVLAVVLAGVLLAACSSEGDKAAAEPEPLTLTQASLLAEVLSRNLEVGGATFVVTALDPRTGATVRLDGAVDWTAGHGTAVVSGLRDAAGPVTAVAWTRDGVAEQRPVADAGAGSGAGAGAAAQPAPFILRTVDTDAYTIDRLIAIVLGLATERPDNAQLVLQKPDAGFVRTDVLRGVDVEVLRYSGRTVLWIEPTSGALLRLESTDVTGSAPVVVDLIERAPQRIVLPDATLP